MNETKKKVILDLTYKMIIEPSQGFPPHEFEESVKLFMRLSNHSWRKIIKKIIFDK